MNVRTAARVLAAVAVAAGATLAGATPASAHHPQLPPGTGVGAHGGRLVVDGVPCNLDNTWNAPNNVSVEDNRATWVSDAVRCGRWTLEMRLDMWDPDPAYEARPWGDFAVGTYVMVTERTPWYEPTRVCATWRESHTVAGSDGPAWAYLQTSGTGCGRTFSLDYELMYADAGLFNFHF